MTSLELLGWFYQQPYAKMSSRTLIDTSLKIEFECHDKNGVARSFYAIIRPEEFPSKVLRDDLFIGKQLKKRLQGFKKSLEAIE